jgi:dipeptidyl aminopeptidase/acylaminoacyl peptidase
MIRRATLLLLFVGLCVRTEANPQETSRPRRRLTIEDALGWRIPSSPAISPDGKRVAYIVGESDFERSQVVTHLWWVDTETRATRRLTSTDDGAASPSWSPDGRWLAFLSQRGAETDAAKRRTQIWALPTDGGEAIQVTRAPEGVLHYRWAPEGKSIYYVALETRPKPAETLRAEQQKRKMDAVLVDEEKLRREIWRAAVDGNKAERVFAGDPGVDAIEPSPDGKWIAFRTNYTGLPDDDRKFDLWLVDATTGRARQLTMRAGEERSPVWSPDSTRIAFLAPRDPKITYSQPEVFLVSPAGAEAPEPQRLTKTFSGNIERLHWPSKGNGIYFAAAVRTESRLYALNPADGTIRPAGPERGTIEEPSWTPDGGMCAAVQESATSLPDVVVLRSSAAATEPQRVTDLNPQLKDFALGAQEVIRWKSKDGMEIEGILVKPPEWQAGQRHPLLVDIHGGPHDHRSNTLRSGNFPQVWAARGWLVLQPNFRGSSGYGHEFGIANRGDIGGKDYEDVMAGVDSAIAQGWADEKRMAVFGGSYGGYMANWIIGRTQRFQAAVSFYGIFNLITDYSNSVFPSWEPDYLTKYYWDDLDAYLDRSPMKHVKQITTPVLIIHGEADDNTFIANSQEMYRALKDLGRTVRFARLPREGHGFREPNHRVQQYRLMMEWLDAHALGGGDARVREMHEPVARNGWELKVAGARTVESYGGIKPKGRFVEVEFLIRATMPTQERFALLVFDTAGSEVTLVADGRAVSPAGLVVESLGQRLLAKSSGQIVAIEPDKDGHHSALAVAVAFDAPADAREFTLRVKEFAPIRIELPAEKK